MWYLNTRKNTIFLHVKISIISLTSGLSLKLYLNSLVYHRNIFGSSSKVLGNLRKSSDIFGNFRKFSENVRERSCGLRDNLKNLRKSSEGGRKSSENHEKRRHQYVYVIKRILHVARKYEFYVLVAISSRHRVIFSIESSLDSDLCNVGSCRRSRRIWLGELLSCISSVLKRWDTSGHRRIALAFSKE